MLWNLLDRSFKGLEDQNVNRGRNEAADSNQCKLRIASR